MTFVRWWALAVAMAPIATSAQMSDVGYCNALIQKYQAYVANIEFGRTPQPGTVDGQVAVAQCKAGDTAAGIPVLEKKLRDARIDLPPRG
jgi:hypothetical protein